MILAILLSALLSPGHRAYYTDTSEVLGLVSLYPYGNLIVFERELVKFSLPGAATIVRWSKHYIVYRDVDGNIWTIDVRGIRRSARNLWVKPPVVREVNGIVSHGKKLEKPSYAGFDRSIWDPKVRWGVGSLSSPDRLFTTAYDKPKNRTILRAEPLQLRTSPNPLELSIPGQCLPVMVLDKDRYIYIHANADPANDIFSPLYIQSSYARKLIADEVTWFLPLRFR